MKKKEMLERIDYFLGALEHFVENQNANGLFDINKYCEDIFLDLLNKIFNLNLINMNTIKMNFPSIDLGDEYSEVSYQVTSTNNITKIKKTLDEFKKYKLYEKYDTVNILILGKKSKHKKPIKYDEFDFSIQDNIIDFKDISKYIHNKDKDAIEEIYNYLQDNIYKIEPKSGCYYENITEEEVKEGKSYSNYIEKFIGEKINTEEGQVLLEDVKFFIAKLKYYDKNTRSVIQAIIDKNKRIDEGVFFNREVVMKYLGIPRESLYKELKILQQDGHLESVEDSGDEYDRIFFMSKEKAWEMLSDIVKFCEEYDKDISKIIMDLDFTILD